MTYKQWTDEKKYFKKMELDTSQLKLESLITRQHDLDLSIIQPLTSKKSVHKNFLKVSEKIFDACSKGASVILMMGAHVIRSGVQRYIIDLMKRGFISCIAINGAGVIHDYEFALIGATTESVARYIGEGKFGLWKETGQINEIVNRAFIDKLGMGEAVGRAILEGDFPYREISLFAQAYKYKVPMTVHVGIGYDIIHGHPNFDGAATGAASYKDFLTFAGIVQNLENGVTMNFGSAVMAPEVFLKALSMARNVAHQEGRVIKHFTSLVCDLHNLPANIRKEPSKDDAAYYFRPLKTMLVRTVADGGESFYVRGRHDDTIPSLWSAINEEERRLKE